jgi:hypothetical protein
MSEKSDQAVRNHIEDYTLCHKLKPENGGSEEKLSKIQSKIKLLMDSKKILPMQFLKSKRRLYSDDMLGVFHAIFSFHLCDWNSHGDQL